MKSYVLGLTIALGALVGACNGGEVGPDAGSELPQQYTFGGDRPVELQVPAGYDHEVPTPLVILLHGYGANGYVQAAYTGLNELVDEAGVFLAAPDGTEDSEGKLFWNATAACCDFEGRDIDDVAYIDGLIADISGVWNVDPDRVYLVGHSNGGFMAYRMACERAGDIAAIVSLAGAAVAEDAPTTCDPTDQVSVLQIHGTDDQVIAYEGRNECSWEGCEHPSAPESVRQWAGHDGCDDDTTTGDPIDIERRLDGAETSVQRHVGCPDGVGAELWTIEGGEHLPSLNDDFRTELWEWLAMHPRR